MKKSVKTIETIALMGIMIILAYWPGTMQTETVTEIQTVTETEIVEVEKIIEVVPDGYMDVTSEDFINNFVDMRTVVDFSATEYGLQLYFEDGT